MEQKQNRSIWVIGHKNPDTDSICSAIAYANLKNKISANAYEPKRAGEINEETRFVLRYFEVEEPEFVSDVGTQIRDIEIRETKGVSSNLSLKQAWELMKETGVVTLPIVNRRRLEGLITVADIANSYMDVYDNRVLARAETQFKNIVDTLGGTLLCGDPQQNYTQGKIIIAAANPDLMENYIEEGDLVILGNRYESQFSAIEMQARILVICDGSTVSKTILKLAEERNCAIISTPYDTFTVARLINQSMPIKYFMTSDNLICFHMEDLIDEIKGTMARLMNRDFPVLDKNGLFCGMISRRNLLGARRKQIILVDHNERRQAADGVENAEILEIIDHHRLGTIETMSPVFFRNQPLGCTATIIAQMYEEEGVVIDRPIAGILCSAIISDTLLFRSPTCTEVDRNMALKLAKIAAINPEKFAREMFAASNDMAHKDAREILMQDFKVFGISGMNVGIGQINLLDQRDFKLLQEKLTPLLEETRQAKGLDRVFFMITSILDQESLLLAGGEEEDELVKAAFGKVPQEQALKLPGVVSRKKQLVPALTLGLQSI